MRVLPLLTRLMEEFEGASGWGMETWLPTPHRYKTYPHDRIPLEYLPAIESVMGKCPSGLAWRLKFILYAPAPTAPIMPHVDFGTRTWKIAEFLSTPEICVSLRYVNDIQKGLCLGEQEEHDFITNPKYYRGVVLLFEAPKSNNYIAKDNTTYGQLVSNYLLTNREKYGN